MPVSHDFEESVAPLVNSCWALRAKEERVMSAAECIRQCLLRCDRQVAGVDLLLNAAHFNEKSEARHKALLLEQCSFLGGTIPELIWPTMTARRLQWGSDGEQAVRPCYKGPPYLVAFDSLMCSLVRDGKAKKVHVGTGQLGLPIYNYQTSTPSMWIGDDDMHMLHALELVSYCFPDKDEKR
jgi:hypothetical protein